MTGSDNVPLGTQPYNAQPGVGRSAGREPERNERRALPAPRSVAEAWMPVLAQTLSLPRRTRGLESGAMDGALCWSETDRATSGR